MKKSNKYNCYVLLFVFNALNVLFVIQCDVPKSFWWP